MKQITGAWSTTRSLHYCSLFNSCSATARYTKLLKEYILFV